MASRKWSDITSTLILNDDIMCFIVCLDVFSTQKWSPKKHKQIRSPGHPPLFSWPLPLRVLLKVWFQINEAIRQHNIPQLSGAPGTGKRFVPFIYGFNYHAQENLCFSFFSSRRFLFGSSAYFLAQEKANTWETWPPVWPSAVTRSISTRTSQWRWWPAFSEGCARATCGASWKTSICSPDRSCPSFPVTFR